MPLFDLDLSTATPFDFANMTPYELGRNVFLPFLLVFAIFYGILSMLGIFNKKTNAIISIIMSILLATTPAFTALSLYITQLGATTAVVIFGAVFILGTAVWAINRGRDIYEETGGHSRKLIKLEKKENDLMDKYNRTTDPNKKDAMWKQVERIRREKHAVEAAMRRRRY